MSPPDNALKTVFLYARATVANFMEDDGSVYAAGLAFYALVSVIPLCAVLLALGGSLLASAGRDSATALQELTGDIVTGMRVLVPFMPEEDLRAILLDIVEHRQNLGAVGVVVLLLAASQVVNAIRRAVARPFGITFTATGDASPVWRGARTALWLAWHRLKTFFWIAALGFITGVLRIAMGALSRMLQLLPLELVEDLLRHPLVAPLVTQATGAVFTFVGFQLILVHVARRQTTWQARALAGLAFALLQGVAEALFGSYVQHYAALSFKYGSLAGVVAVSIWIFYASCVFLLCVELCAIVSKPARLYLHFPNPTQG